MSPSALPNGAVALLAACGIGASSAYVPPSTALTSVRRPAGATLMSSASSDFDAGIKITSGSSRSTYGSSKNTPLSPLSGPSSPPSSLPYIRIQKRGRHYDVQTAVTTFQKIGGGGTKRDHVLGASSKTTVDLHAQIHFGDASYFQYFNDDAFASRYDQILYELIVEDRFLSPTDAPGLRQLIPAAPGSARNPIAPTQADRATAAQYGLQCQVDGIEYCREGWVHADLTREEFVGWAERGERRQQQKAVPQVASNRQQPLWALASTSATYPGAELVTSLLRPLTTTSNSASAALTRRLFTHLFLPGDALSGWIRAALWLGVPSPELSILLVDWSSLSYMGRGRRRGSVGEDESKNVAPISPIAAPVLLSLLTGNWGTARRLVFGQVLVGGQSSADTSKGGVLIDKRNERALEVLRRSLDAGGGDKKRVALLYGAGHCRDLHRRLGEEGLTPVRTEWRTAFRATAPRWGDFVKMDLQARSRDIASTLPAAVDGESIVKGLSVSTLESVAVGLVILPLYLLVGGLDWVSTLGDLGNALDGGMYLDGVADVLLYLVRHVALYVGISKFVVDWGGNDGVFEEE